MDIYCETCGEPTDSGQFNTFDEWQEAGFVVEWDIGFDGGEVARILSCPFCIRRKRDADAHHQLGKPQ